MKPRTSTAIKCWRYSVVFYLILYCFSGVGLGVFVSFLLLFRYNIHHILGSKRNAFYFLFIPSVLTITTTVIGWRSVKKRNFKLIKCVSVLMAITAVFEIAGSLWCFISHQEAYDEVLVHLEQKFLNRGDILNESWWNNIQRKFKCCGLHGPTDYHSTQKVPVSCCGYNPDDNLKSACSLIWQEGCSNILGTDLSQDLILLSITAACVAFLQIPGVFISWCFSNRISRERKL